MMAVAVAITSAQTACAQQVQAGADIEEIEVVGRSQVPSDVTANAPITLVDAAAIAKTSTTTLEALLTKLPSFGFQGVNGNQNDGGYGAAFVDLHNLNFNRTLVLVDGKRFVLSGIKTDEAVDLNNIPLALIDHVDVLRDGSEPEYGADAVAGVVNIVLKKQFSGLQISTYTGVAGAGDGFTRSLDATWDHRFENGNVTLSVGSFHRDPIEQSSRSWSRLPISDAGFSPNGSIRQSYGSSAAPGGHAISADSGIDAIALRLGQSRPYDAATDFYNPADETYLQGSTDRKTANAIARYSINDDFEGFGQILFTDRIANTRLPPQILGENGTAKYPAGFVVPAGNTYNPFGEDVSLERVLTEAGPLDTTTDGTTWRGVAGFQGTIADKIDWSVSYDHGESDATFKTRNSTNLSHVFDTLGVGPDDCGATLGCVSADYFGPDSLSPQAVRYISYTDTSKSTYREDVAEADAGLSLATLPGGQLVLSSGLQYRYEAGRTSLDPVTLSGDQAGPDSAPTSGGYSAREGFIDLDIPILHDLPYAKVLAADASARYSDYSRFGSFPTWKASLNYAPNADFRLRVTAGIAERVPAITEAFGGIAANLVAVADPCDAGSGERSNPIVDANCRVLGLGSNFKQSSALINIASGGNQNLVPETSRNLTLGAVMTPHWLPGFSLTADYYHIKIANAIDSLADTDADFIPDQCYTSAGLLSPVCPLVERVPTGPNAGQINRILGLDENIGSIDTDGIDFSLTYKQEITSLGTLTIGSSNSMLLHYLVHTIGQLSAIEYASHFASLVNVGSYTRFKSNLTMDLAGDDWSVGWTIRYIGGASLLGADPAVTPYSSAPPLIYHDIVASYTIKPVTVTAGIDNLADTSPPLLIDGSSNTNLNSYDAIGRFFYLRLTAEL